MSSQKLKSEGKRLFCGKIFAKTGINRHLKTHLQQKATKNAKGESYLVKIEANPRYGATGYGRLHLCRRND